MRRFDVPVTDVMMPGMTGDALASTLRASHPELSVLYMSGHVSREVIERGALSRGADFLQKPFDPRELARHVRRLAARRGGAAARS